jgi:hypothetical protein
MSDITLTAEEAALVVEALRGYAAYANKRDGDRMAQLSHKLESVPQPRPSCAQREAAMAERAPKLEWEETTRAIRWRAFAGPLRLHVQLDALGVYAWTVLDGTKPREGVAYSSGPLLAQLAAEAACLQWLTEGVTALGGRVLTGEQVALCVEALRGYGDDLRIHNRHEPRRADAVARGAEMLQLARELGEKAEVGM